jgi:hypothetical protein
MNHKPYFVKILGYVNNLYVIAFVYNGKDKGLSHYKLNNKTYVGTVQFTKIVSKESLYY